MFQKETWEPESNKRWDEEVKGPLMQEAGIYGSLAYFWKFTQLVLPRNMSKGFDFFFMKGPTSKHLVCARSPAKALSIQGEAGSAQFPIQ